MENLAPLTSPRSTRGRANTARKRNVKDLEQSLLGADGSSYIAMTDSIETYDINVLQTPRHEEHPRWAAMEFEFEKVRRVFACVNRGLAY